MMVGPSSWLAGAAAAKLRAEALRDFLDAWEAEHGALTSDEIDRAEAELAPTDWHVGVCVVTERSMAGSTAQTARPPGPGSGDASTLVPGEVRHARFLRAVDVRVRMAPWHC